MSNSIMLNSVPISMPRQNVRHDEKNEALCLTADFTLDKSQRRKPRSEEWVRVYSHKIFHYFLVHCSVANLV